MVKYKKILTYWWVLGGPKTSLSKFSQENDGKLKDRKRTLENKSVLQKMKYNKNYDRVWKTRV